MNSNKDSKAKNSASESPNPTLEDKSLSQPASAPTVKKQLMKFVGSDVYRGSSKGEDYCFVPGEQYEIDRTHPVFSSLITQKLFVTIEEKK